MRWNGEQKMKKEQVGKVAAATVTVNVVSVKRNKDTTSL